MGPLFQQPPTAPHAPASTNAVVGRTRCHGSGHIFSANIPGYASIEESGSKHAFLDLITSIVNHGSTNALCDPTWVAGGNEYGLHDSTGTKDAIWSAERR